MTLFDPEIDTRVLDVLAEARKNIREITAEVILKAPDTHPEDQTKEGRSPLETLYAVDYSTLYRSKEAVVALLAAYQETKAALDLLYKALREPGRAALDSYYAAERLHR